MYYLLLAFIVTVIFAAVLVVLRELQGIRAEHAELRRRLEALESRKDAKALTASQEEELNLIWAELETLRRELPGFLKSDWVRLLHSKVPLLKQVRVLIEKLSTSDRQVAEMLKSNLPEYIFSDEPLTGFIDFARTPFERINWLDSVLLPLSAHVEKKPQLEETFLELVNTLGFKHIYPEIGTTYDPTKHEPVEQKLAEQRGVILAVRSRGYEKDGRILIKARVVISA
ncbi:MAG: nucleotide exchange factor GrpE [Acidobacteriota bacterium]|nr:nucleotide exchange factor GrpE [Blastocatellia bacterium]MDW8412360.1 nucleotide exchange factor GrpE [Acidobacteriota bacterium]